MAGELGFGLAVDGFDVHEMNYWQTALGKIDEARAKAEGRLVSGLLSKGKR